MIPLAVLGAGDKTILAVHGGPGTEHGLFRPELDRLCSVARMVPERFAAVVEAFLAATAKR